MSDERTATSRSSTPGSRSSEESAPVEIVGQLARLRHRLDAVANVAARRWHAESDDARQDAYEAATRHLRRGLSERRIVGRVFDELVRQRSPLAGDRNRRLDPHDSTSIGEDPPRLRREMRIGSMLMLTTEDAARFAGYPATPLRLLARLTSSTLSAQLERMRTFATSRCPACRSASGDWRRWGSELTQDRCCEPSASDRGRDAASMMEPGQTLAGVPAVAPRSLESSEDDVWLCGRCGRWTREPVTRMSAGPSALDYAQKVSGAHWDTGATEDAMIDYVDAVLGFHD